MADPGAAPRFAVTTFERVFDTEPNRDVVSLGRLVDGLQHFLLKPETRAKVERTERQIEAAWDDFRHGRHRSGKAWSALFRAKRQAEDEGADESTAMAAAEAEVQNLLSLARSDPKRDLRIWSPAHYPPASRRGSENVVHLSCLVLDYDSGLPVDEASAAWSDYFHVVHSTWSHRTEKPKYRLILPLAEPVQPQDWRRVYEWAEERSDHAVDPSGKSIGTTFALPAVADEAMPRIALRRPGPLFDARLEGLIDQAAPPPPDDVEPHAPNHFRIPIPGHRTVGGACGSEAGPAPGTVSRATTRSTQAAASAASAASTPSASVQAIPKLQPISNAKPSEVDEAPLAPDDPWNDASFPWD